MYGLSLSEMVLKMPVVLGKHEALLNSFKTGLGLSFDDTGIEHCQMHRHAVSTGVWSPVGKFIAPCVNP